MIEIKTVTSLTLRFKRVTNFRYRETLYVPIKCCLKANGRVKMYRTGPCRNLIIIGDSKEKGGGCLASPPRFASLFV